MISIEAFIATNRFGLGPRPGDLAKINSAPKAWLHNQVSLTLNVPSEVRNELSAPKAMAAFKTLAKTKDRMEKKTIRKQLRDSYLTDVYQRSLAMINSEKPFAERLVQFWSNHFTVSASGRKVVAPMALHYENEAIRPHIFSSFENMLISVIQHPAMLMYLDNHASMGPNSKTGRKRKRGLNENLAREILELHTLGVNGGYTQKDVREFAKILTGWSVTDRSKSLPSNAIFTQSGFQFKPWMHESGSKDILGRHYEEAGFAEGMDALRFLAQHPSTAKFIATKLVRHFVADSPPPSAIAKIEKVFRSTNGDLKQVSHALIDLTEIWQRPLSKTKQPYELVISTFRALGINRPKQGSVINSFRTLRQLPFQAPSPAGWADESSIWLTPEALMRRIEWTRIFAAKYPRNKSPQEFLSNTIEPVASAETKQWFDLVPSGEEAIALALASPEFQRR